MKSACKNMSHEDTTAEHGHDAHRHGITSISCRAESHGERIGNGPDQDGNNAVREYDLSGQGCRQFR